MISINEIINNAKNNDKHACIAVAAAEDDAALKAVCEAKKMGRFLEKVVRGNGGFWEKTTTLRKKVKKILFSMRFFRIFERLRLLYKATEILIFDNCK